MGPRAPPPKHGHQPFWKRSTTHTSYRKRERVCFYLKKEKKIETEITHTTVLFEILLKEKKIV
jgi:hypothetical protein